MICIQMPLKKSKPKFKHIAFRIEIVLNFFFFLEKSSFCSCGTCTESDIPIKCEKIGSPLVAQQVKDPALWLGSQLWLRCHPWPGNFFMLQAWPGKKKEMLVPGNKNV